MGETSTDVCIYFTQTIHDINHHTLKRDPMEENLVLLDVSSARRGNKPATKVQLEAIKRS